MTTVERLQIQADVTGNFKRQLTTLSALLAEVGELADVVDEELDDIDVSVDGIEKANAELASLDRLAESVDDDITIDVGNEEVLSPSVVGGNDQPVADAVSGTTASQAVGDGGGSSFISDNQLQRLNELFGDAFDEGTFVDRGGEVTSPIQLTEDQLSEYADNEAVVQGFIDGDISGDELRSAIGSDFDSFIDSQDGELGKHIDFSDSSISLDEVGRLEDVLGEAFDREAFIQQRGDIDNIDDVVEGSMVDYLDLDAISQALERGDINKRDIEFGDSIDDWVKTIDELGGMADLPKQTSFIETLQNVELNMSKFYDILASLLPLIGVFVGAIPAAVTAIGALATAAIGAAGALGAIGALGVLGMGLKDGKIDMSVYEDRIEEIATSFIDEFDTLAEDFSPLAEEGVDGIQTLFARIASYGDTLRAFKDDARALGGYLLKNLPYALALLVRMGETFDGVFANLAQFTGEADVIQTIARTFEESETSLARFGLVLASFLPTIVNLSQGFLDVASGILYAVKGLSRFLTLLPITSRQMGALLGVILTSITALSMYIGVTKLLSSSLVSSLLPSLGVVGSQLQAYTFNALVAAGASYTLAQSLATLISFATLGLGAIFAFGALTSGIGAMTDKFSSLGDSVEGTTDKLKDFKDVSDSLDGPSSASGTLTQGSYIDYSTANMSITVDGSGDSESTERATQAASYRAGTTLDKYFSS